MTNTKNTQSIQEMLTTTRGAFVAAQAVLDEIAQDRQALQAHHNSEVERLKLETENLDRESKAKDAKFTQAQQDAMTEKLEARGLLAGLEKLAEA